METVLHMHPGQLFAETWPLQQGTKLQRKQDGVRKAKVRDSYLQILC